MRWAQNGSSQSLPSRRANTLRPIQKEPAQSKDIRSVNAINLMPIHAGVVRSCANWKCVHPSVKSGHAKIKPARRPKQIAKEIRFVLRAARKVATGRDARIR